VGSEARGGSEGQNADAASIDDHNSKLKTLTRTGFANATSNYAYDQASRVTQIETRAPQNGNALLANYGYAYDTAGRVKQFTTNVEGPTTYDYATCGRLLGASGGGGSESYSYDVNGNRNSTGYVTQTGTNRILQDGTYSYTYDNEGNLIRKARLDDPNRPTLYTWDYRNRLTSVSVFNVGLVTYLYDPFDRCIGADRDLGEIGRKRYIYDGQNVVLSFERGYNLQAGDLQATDLAHRYLYGPGIDQLLAEETLSPFFDTIPPTPRTLSATWTLADALATVRDVVGVSGGAPAVVDHLKYDSYGNILTQTNAAHQPQHTYTGRERDAITGLYYDRARWYDAGTGRFVSEDPIGFAGGSVNLYQYVGNSPTNGRDPSGLCGDTINPPANSGAGTCTSSGWAHVSSGGKDYYVPASSMSAVSQGVSDIGRPAISVASGSGNPSKIRGFGLGALYGLAVGGKGLTYPARWVGIDMSSQDEALRDLESQLFAPEDSTPALTKLVAGGGTCAAYAAVGVAAWGAVGGGQFAVGVTRGSGSWLRGWLRPHYTFGWGRGGVYQWGHGLGEGFFTTEFNAGAGTINLTGIPVLFPEAVGTWVATQPDVGDCFRAMCEAYRRGCGR